jgi:hypothetical protein
MRVYISGNDVRSVFNGRGTYKYTMAEICMSRRNHKVLVDQQFRFQEDRQYKNKTYWKCVEYKTSCKARLHTIAGQC